MAPTNNVLLFSPEHSQLLSAIHQLNVRSKTNAQIRNFLSKTSSLVNELVAGLDAPERNAVGSFEDVVELAEQHIAQGRQNAVAEIILLTTVQLGQLLVLVQDKPTLLSSSQEIPVAFGYGIGSFAAAVAATARNADEIVSLGLRGVAVAFRLAVQLFRIGRDVEESTGEWARIVSGLDLATVQKQLDAFNAKLQPLRRAYVGQSALDSVVVHGPPSTLVALAKEAAFAGLISEPSSPYRSPVYGAHLPRVDVNDIVGASPKAVFSAQQPLYSAHSAKEAVAETKFEELLRLAVSETIYKPVQIADTVKTLAADLKKAGSSKVVLTTVGNTWDATSAKELFSKAGHQFSISDAVPTPKAFGNDVDSIPEDAIAIVGMSGRFPQSETLDELWNLLQSETTTHQEIPADRFSVDDFYDPSRKTHNALLARFGCFLKKPGEFDNRLFNISPREAMQMDPVQRMLLMTTYEALEMAGYSETNEQAPPKIATYFGQTVDDWKTINMQQGIDTHFLPAVNRGFAPGRLCHYFKWAGGFYSIDTGCSSSATGICIARDALTAGRCDAAIVGGGTLLTSPEWFSGLSQGGFLSPTGACKTYSETADGYCRGEGVAVVVLKRLRDAIKAKDNVLAVIAGAQRNTNAGEGSITHPGQHAQESLYRRTLRDAAVQPHEVEVVEMHGTGTQAGDRVESTAVHNVFVTPESKTKRAQPLIVGAIKANLGHSEAAAGVVSLIKAILILQRNTIPPQPNQPIKLNPYLIPLLNDHMQLANGQKWTRSGADPRYVFINNFDAAGGNCSTLIQDAPAYAIQQALTKTDARAYHVVVASGRTPAALAANKEALRQYLVSHPKTDLASLAYTTTARRIHQANREAFVTSSISDLLRQLEQPAAKNPPAAAASTVFAFTGQGAQYVGMGGALYRSSPSFQRLLDSYQRLCDAQGLDCQILNAIVGEGDKTADNTIATERDMQVATVALEIALARYWESLGVEPGLLIGHSLGEFAALAIAGVLSVGDALALAHKRATLIFSSNPPAEAGMLAVSLPQSTVQWRIRDLPATTSSVEVCCINGPSSTVVGGPIAAIEALDNYLKSENVMTTRLAVKYAFHTRQMDNLLDELEATASNIPFHAPKKTIASTLLGRLVKPGEEGVFNANYIRRHTREPVYFLDAVRACEAAGLIKNQSFIVEIGPHPVCIALIASSLEKANPTRFPSIRRKQNDLEIISQAIAAAHVAQIPVSWAAYHQDHLENVRLISDLPFYAFENKTFWASYVTETKGSATATKAIAPAPASVTRLSSTSLQAVEEVKKEGSKVIATFTADTADHHLCEAIGGHVVDGVAICPASVFMDMAYTAAKFLSEKEFGAEGAAVTNYKLTDLKMESPMVLRKDDAVKPKVRVEGKLDLNKKVVAVHFRSSKGEGALVSHGSCNIVLSKPEASGTQPWDLMSALVKSRVRTLENSKRPHEVYGFDRRLFYKTFSEIVDYASEYHAVEEATIAHDFSDASVLLQSPTTADLGSFTCNPHAMDAIVHVAGFLINSDVNKPKDVVYIANLIGSFQVLGDLSMRKPVRCYATVRDRDEKHGICLCDVYVTNDANELIATCTDIRFQKLDRDFFAMLTGSNRAVASKPKKAAAPPKKAAPKAVKVVEPESDDDDESVISSGASTPITNDSEAVNLSKELFKAVALRSGMDNEELKKAPDMTFTDMGVDSQMSIQVISDFQKATGVELPAAFFSNFPTPAAVEEELGAEPESAPVEKPKKEKKAKKESAPAPAKKSKKQAEAPRPSKQLLTLIADALGLDDDSLTPDTSFESVGMDSMLSIKITSAFQAETGVELPAAFFSSCTTVGAVQEELDEPEAEEAEAEVKPAAPVAKAPKAAPVVETPVNSSRQQKLDNAVSRPVLIQGKSRSREAPVFMTTDGSGTVESYIHLSPLPEGRRIYALESPFLTSPEDFDLSIQEMATIFVRSIRKIQPKGPYLIGGWSAGSIYAYEVAHRLATQGEIIQELMIIDMRAPSLIPTTIVTPEFVDKLGTFEGINRARDLPQDLSVKERNHLMATCRALSRYDAPDFPEGFKPQHSIVVWARLGLDANPDAPKAAMHRPHVSLGKPLDQISLDEYEYYFNSWFYGRRFDFGSNGWEDYLGNNISVYDVDGDHFSMMVPPLAGQVGKIVHDTIEASFAKK